MTTKKHPLAVVREAMELSQEALARALGVSLQMISSLERGAYVGTGWKAFEKLSTHLSISLDTARALCIGTISRDELTALLETISQGE